MMYRPSYAEIHLDHLAENFLLLKNSLKQNEFLCPMVKANAYGHGAVEVSNNLFSLGAKQVGVCLLEEALELRQAGITQDILVFRGFDDIGAKVILQNQFIAVCSDWSHLEFLKKNSLNQPIRLHLKFDTGMNRLGFAVEQAEKIKQFLSDNSVFQLEGICTHLLRGDDIDSAAGATHTQLKKMLQVEEVFSSLTQNIHCYNSAGFMGRLSLQNSQAKLPEYLAKPWGVRPGIMLYGSQPSEKTKHIQLRPVMSLRSQVQLIRRVSAGEGVSYNSTFIAQRESKIAIVPVGYADGYHRLLSNRGVVLIQGEQAPVVGNVCMDYLMVDVTEIKKQNQIDENSVVTLFGYDEHGQLLDANHLAAKAETISYELFTSVSQRIPRLVKGDRK